MTNVWYVKNILANCDGNMYLPILHLPRIEFVPACQGFKSLLFQFSQVSSKSPKLQCSLLLIANKCTT